MPKNTRNNVTIWLTKANFFKVVWKRFLNEKCYQLGIDNNSHESSHLY